MRRAETQIFGLPQKFWKVPEDLNGYAFSVQFAVLEPEMSLRRTYLEHGRNFWPTTEQLCVERDR